MQGRNADTARLRFWLDLEMSQALARFEAGQREITERMIANRTMRDGIRLKEELWLAESVLRPVAKAAWHKVTEWGGGTVAAPGHAHHRLSRLLEQMADRVINTAKIMSAGDAAIEAVRGKVGVLQGELDNASQIALLGASAVSSANPAEGAKPTPVKASFAKPGRRKGIGGYRMQDEAIARDIRGLREQGDTRSPSKIAKEDFEARIVGSPHDDNHIKRIARVYWDMFPPM